MTSKILFLLPDVERASTPLKELKARHVAYLSGGNFQSLRVNLFGVVVIGKSKKEGRLDHNMENLSVIFTHETRLNLLLYPFRVARLVRKRNIDPDWIVAGDGHLSLLYALLIRFLSCKSAKIQVSLHSEFGSFNQRNLKALVLSIPLRVMKNKVELFRFVSINQSLQFTTRLKLFKSKHIVVPVPIIPIGSPARTLPGKSYLGFIGRIHMERGVEEWTWIARHTAGFEFLVVGSGPLEGFMKDQLPSAKFTGYVESEGLSEVWSTVAILLSCAPLESYGMVLREALLHNVPVVSRRNAGSEELHTKFPDLVKVYDDPNVAVSLIEQLMTNTPLDSSFKDFREDFIVQQANYLGNLARVWCNEI
jgi:glycosyltransferase involved in cell wall biosynthesis